MTTRPTRRPRRGAATVEFAVVVPVLLLFVLGIVEVGRLVMVAQLATNGSREGARYAAQGSADAAAVEAYTRSYLAAAGIPSAAVTDFAVESQTTTTAANGTTTTSWDSAANPSAVSQGTAVRVTFTINYNQVSWVPSRFVLRSGTQLQGVSVMRKE